MLLLFATFILRAVGGDFSRLSHFQSELGMTPLPISFGVDGGYFSPQPLIPLWKGGRARSNSLLWPSCLNYLRPS